jgi:YbbR domain-containing protein
VKQFMKKHDIWLRLLSLVLAFVLWAIAVGEENPDRPMTFTGIAVSVTGEDSLLSAHGLSLIESDISSVSVTVHGPRNQVTDKSMRSRITAEIDISSCTQAGEYDLPVKASVQRTGVEVSSVNPKTVHVRIDQVTSAQVPVRVEATGTPLTGYRAGKAEPVTAESVTIEGPASELAEVAYAYAVISADGKSATAIEECPIELFSDTGEPITSEHVTCTTERIRVRLPIYPIETIPLTISLKDDGLVTADMAEVSIDPVSVKVVGDPKAIANIAEINLGEIDLASVRTGVPIEMPIPLPDGVRLDEGQPQTARITITIEGVETKTIDVSRFALNDTSTEEGAYQATVASQSVSIVLRGSESALSQVSDTSFTIGLTYDSSALGAGTHRVRGVIVASGLPVGVTLVEEDVQVLLELTPTETSTPSQEQTPDDESTTEPSEPVDATEPEQSDDTDAETV